MQSCILGVSIDHIWDFGGLRSIQHSESEVTDTLTRQASFSVLAYQCISNLIFKPLNLKNVEAVI